MKSGQLEVLRRNIMLLSGLMPKVDNMVKELVKTVTQEVVQEKN